MTEEQIACAPHELVGSRFNTAAVVPYGLQVEHVAQTMQDFVDFLGFVNTQLNIKEIPRLESFLMPANFSSMVGEFMAANLPKYCIELAKNQYHNGHPDLIPANQFENDAVQYSDKGIEIKASRRASGWQGHNPEAVWLMLFYFDSNTSADAAKGIAPKRFVFKGVYAALLDKDDWTFSGRSATSRRTITASVNRTGREKMKANWIYDMASGLRK